MAITRQRVRTVLGLAGALGFLASIVLLIGVIVVHNFIAPLDARWSAVSFGIMFVS